ncbi:hypothetical protein EST38_g2350 [Candolleomyces aberdarensis]|uniref:Uncharacterized protein n=1 Tax=Candolleomyces aberdarensis TaxID=2316362 RepID=A0A4Q2DTS8_9AGAR|nr:hypothetical protein EST38_g2350 [Candolleomyces aberdarensis]
MPFPAPVGGLVLPSDLAPSIVFAVLYALLLPLVAYRIFDRRSRTLLLLGTIIFSVERIVIFSLRAAQSQKVDMRLSTGLLKYMQVSFGVGFIGLANDLVNLLRCLLVNPTYGPEKWEEAPASSTKETYFQAPEQGDEDRPKERFWVRRYSDFTNLAFMAASIPGGIGGSQFNRNHFTSGDSAKANRAMTFRYASASVALFLMFMIQAGALWSRRKQRRHCERAISLILAISLLTTVVAVYRLSVMWHESPALDSTVPGTLNSPGAKASFYILHILPEWLASAILLGFNTRKSFGTGAFGDWRGVDDRPKDIERREKRKAKRAAKKAEKSGEKRVELVSGSPASVV